MSLDYEYLVQDYAGTMTTISGFLGLSISAEDIPGPSIARLADEETDAWVARYRNENDR